MKTMKWLIRRELWEHKGMFVWTPLAVAAVIGVITIVLGHHFTLMATPLSQTAVEGPMRGQLLESMTRTYMAASLPLDVLLGFLVFFYCLNALHDERRDRSLLFWKSLPVSDRMTVLSKAAVALIVAPLIISAIAYVLSLLLLLVDCSILLVHGTNLFGALLAAPDFYLTPLRMLSMLPVYVLWALPTVGWLLLVSSTARSKVLLYAVGAPVVTALLLLWMERSLHLAVNTGWFVDKIVRRILLGVLPGAWAMFEHQGDSTSAAFGKLTGQATGHADLLLSSSWDTLGTPSVWVGVAAGVAMIAGAIWMRRRREEG